MEWEWAGGSSEMMVQVVSDGNSVVLRDGGAASSIAIKGSLGYVPPEYGMGGEASTEGDVYSYGIMLLELFTGKRPTDDMFEGGLSLHEFAKRAMPTQVIEIVDQLLLLEGNDDSNNVNGRYEQIARVNECLVSIVGIGIV
ncbi:Protein kinase domain-containing protein [Cinnamomum micranthum f. kanehirae]|uniref:Protein kinase domain-containing protein n=1 Tax=Cinnamomum micranthum f. kanehirae TaxID=337451 RepID=A0A443PJE2_9MAGN|nr:Protein kinase domain-containing protein [Cinnamomum micranthum f. kanehirae]